MSLVYELKKDVEAGDPYEEIINEFTGTIEKLREENKRNIRNLTENVKDELSSLTRIIDNNLDMIRKTHYIQNTKIDTSLASIEIKLECSMKKIERDIDSLVDKLSGYVPICNLRDETESDNDRHSLQTSGSFVTARSSQNSISFTDDDDTLIGRLDEEVDNDGLKCSELVKNKPLQSNIMGESNFQSPSKTKTLNNTLKEKSVLKNCLSSLGTDHISPIEKKEPFNVSPKTSKEAGKEDVDSTTTKIKNESNLFTTYKRPRNLKKFIIEKEDKEGYSTMYKSKTPCTLHYFYCISKKFIFLGEGTCKIVYNVGKDKVYHNFIFTKPNETFKFYGQIDFHKMSTNHFVVKVHNGDDIDVFKIIFNTSSECGNFTDCLSSLI
uniref:BppU_N domain-containing protein n=1 Tax=Strongyloides venezuelensis TaxID=75913 RepID=A0A0K0FD97_STRVS